MNIEAEKEDAKYFATNFKFYLIHLSLHNFLASRKTHLTVVTITQ